MLKRPRPYKDLSMMGLDWQQPLPMFFLHSWFPFKPPPSIRMYIWACTMRNCSSDMDALLTFEVPLNETILRAHHTHLTVICSDITLLSQSIPAHRGTIVGVICIIAFW